MTIWDKELNDALAELNFRRMVDELSAIERGR
jgi:hypothetical protein